MQEKKSTHPETIQNLDGKLFRLIIAQIEDYAIFMIDPNGYILSWNMGASHIKGYAEGEIVGKHMSVFYTEEDVRHNMPRNNLNEALKKGIHEDEGWRVKKDGSLFWANVVFTTIYNEEGHLAGFAKVTRDFTERKLIEDEKTRLNIELEKRVKENTEKIIANELRFRQLIENSHDGISLMDENLNVIYRTKSSQRIMGWDNNERAASNILDFSHPHDKEMVEGLMIDLLANPGVTSLSTYRSKHKDGHYVWVECVYINMLNDVNINAIVCNFRDVTEKKEADEEIAKKTEQIENILESITDGFIALDENLCYTYVNKKIGEMLNREPQTLIGKCIWKEFPEAVDSATYRAISKAIAEQRYICNQDYYAPFDLWQENHIYPSGNGLSIFIRDISQRKKSELEIKQLNENLELKIIERTTQLEAANKELEAFSYSVSHDLRTPLRAINGYSMMLKEDFGDTLGDEGNRVLDTVTNNARLMGQLIDDLLNFSRIGRKELQLYEVDMYALAKACTRELLENNPKKYQIKIDNLPPCLADGSMIKQVWMNLISNAIKYSEKNEDAKIEIGCKKEGKECTYFLRDNGVGFDMEYSNKLFGVFQRLHRHDEFEGTGVGLALVKRIIDKHNGQIWAEAQPGKGATFYFTLSHNN